MSETSETRVKRPRVTIRFEGKGRTIQSQRDECDINVLMRQYQNHGRMPPTNAFPGNYGDFSNVDDYTGSMNRVRDAQLAFEALPSEIRRRFRNSPAELLEFVQDDSNLEEAVELGLIEAKTVPTPPTTSTEVIEPPPRKGG